MGHLRRLKDEYRALVDRLDRGTVALPERSLRRRSWAGRPTLR